MLLLGIISLVLTLAQIGLQVAAYLAYKPPRQAKQAPTFSDFRLAATKIGTPIPATFGLVRIGGNLIEWGDWQVIRHEKVEEMGGGKKKK